MPKHLQRDGTPPDLTFVPPVPLANLIARVSWLLVEKPFLAPLKESEWQRHRLR